MHQLHRLKEPDGLDDFLSLDDSINMIKQKYCFIKKSALTGWKVFDEKRLHPSKSLSTLTFLLLPMCMYVLAKQRTKKITFEREGLRYQIA